MREYFKTALISEEVKEFRNFCKQKGADFIEGEGSSLAGIWVIPKKYGAERLAVYFKKTNGFVTVGQLDESCQNFERGGSGLWKEELKWLRTIFEKIEKWNPKE